MPIKLPGHPDKSLSKVQQAAWRAFRTLLMDPDGPDRIYNQLPESKNGRIISTDIARHLDARYHSTPPGKPRDLAPGDDLAWRYSHDRLDREIRNRGHRKLIRFMAGGWAAGKTHALENQSTIPDLIWDGTLKDSLWAAEMMDLALANGWLIEIAYVYRDLELAFYGAMERAASEGRSVPLELLPSIHRAVQKSIAVLLDLYQTTTGVSFLLLHNIGIKKIRMEALKFSQGDLEPYGALHYSAAHESYYIQAASRFGKAQVERAGEDR
ncbi:MAG: zeta toxin family protein [Verrucomicrobiota bacterium]